MDQAGLFGPIQHSIAVFVELLKVKVAMGVDYSL